MLASMEHKSEAGVAKRPLGLESCPRTKIPQMFSLEMLRCCEVAHGWCPQQTGSASVLLWPGPGS